jgi:S1-C subfamily serine protease
MVNTAGELIGTANGIVRGTRTSNGYGYAILINHALELEVVNELLAGN